MLAKYKYSKPIRRASEEELAWIYGRLSRALERQDVIFSIEKILTGRVLLHVQCDNELCSVYLSFKTGRFSRPTELTIPEMEKIQ